MANISIFRAVAPVADVSVFHVDTSAATLPLTAQDERLAGALLPPLWAIVRSYAHPIELWMYSTLPLFGPRLKTFYIQDELRRAAALGFTNVLAWRRPHADSNWDPIAALRGAVVSPTTAALEWIHAQPTRPVWSDNVRIGKRHFPGAIQAALNAKRPDNVKWLIAHGCKWPGDASAIIARGGEANFEFLRWAVAICPENPVACTWTYAAVCAIAEFGTVAMLEWMQSNESTRFDDYNGPASDAYSCAARGDNLPALNWMRAQNLFGFGRLSSATTLRTVKWLVANGSEWSETPDECDVYASCAEGLEMVQYAREQGSTWTTWVCYRAAERDNLELLTWARDNGCPCNITDVRHAATSNGSARVIGWLEQNNVF